MRGWAWFAVGVCVYAIVVLWLLASCWAAAREQDRKLRELRDRELSE